MKIELVTESMLDELMPLLLAYQRFYRMTPDTERTRDFFRALTVPGNPTGILLLARGEKGEALGFATLYFVPSSLSARTVCVLNDLFTVPATRQRGVGRALIARAADYARERGFRSLDWQTETSNKTAQRLYDKLPAGKSEWYYYSLPLE